MDGTQKPQYCLYLHGDHTTQENMLKYDNSTGLCGTLTTSYKDHLNYVILALYAIPLGTSKEAKAFRAGSHTLHKYLNLPNVSIPASIIDTKAFSQVHTYHKMMLT